jgi:hypothetical protein
MATSVSICSNALLMLGAQTINDLNEDNDRARLASNLYPQIRDDIIRSHPWNCCVKRVILSPDVTPPEFDYSYQFTLPSDWARTLSVGDYGYEEDYKTENGKILANTNVLKLRYIYNNTNEGSWDDLLVGVMSLAMAAVMAYAISQSASLAQVHAAKLDDAMRKARAIDGQDDPPQTFGDFRLLNSRYAGV